jgi:acyl transferase domain-containing protein/thioesterase domain-containing protein
MPQHAERATVENEIAIVGMALRVPGASSLSEFWENLCNGVESIRALSEEELLAGGESPERLRHPRYVRAAAELPAMEMFDAEFFGLSPKEAAIMDPQHRHFLECAWEAIEDSGRIPTRELGPVGVFAGCGMGSYFYHHVCSHRDLVDSVGLFLLRHTGNDKDFLATRASHLFDLRGPSVNVQTACSTSLVAVHYACQSLLSGECDMALAGGVTIELPHRRGYVFEEGEILSPDGHCHAFDHRAAGTVFGSGVGVVVLRRLSDALADGDPIHAVIKATAVNNDGADKAGYLAPSVLGQSSAILEAHALAGVPAETIGYVECHGTGTYLGDPIEVEALTQAFRKGTDAKGFCRIGSVKTNLGHLDTAAGVVSLIKAALAIEHGVIPPSLGFERPNPTIDFEASPFVVNTSLSPWTTSGAPRRAGVNSLGVGGTNAHAVLEEAPARPSSPGVREEEAGPELLVLFAKHRKALDQAAVRLADHLERHPELALADVSYTLFTGRRHFERRRVLAVKDRAEAIALLRAPDARRVHDHSVVADTPSAVFLFPGGGAQHPAMARSLYETEPDFRASVDEGLAYLPPEVARAIRAVWLESAPDDREAATAFLRPSLQLPAILIVEVALARLWMSWGVRPAALIGHSMGENAAACVASVLSFRDAVGLVHLRGELFDSVSGGGMLSVPLSPAEVVDRMPPELDLATVNAPSLSVVSGPRDAIDAFQRRLAEDGIEARPIAIDIAAHSRLLDPILEPFTAFLRGVKLSPPTLPIVSNRTGALLTDAEATSPTYWARHLRETVRFADGMLTLAGDPSRIYVEVGPGKVLSSLVKAQGSVPANQVLNSLPHPDEATDDTLHLLTALGRAFAVGLPVDLSSLWDADTSRKVALPTYPFQHQRYFLERVAPAAGGGEDAPPRKRADLREWGYRPVWKRAFAEPSEDETTTRRWLFFLDDAGLGSRLVRRLRALGHAVTTVTPGDGFVKRGDDAYVLSPEHGRAGYDALVRDLLARGKAPDRIVHLWLVTADESFRPGSSFFHRNLERGFYSLFFLAQALGDENAPRPLHVTVVTNGMQRVIDEPVPYPEKATVLGPSQVVPKELAGVSCRVIDLAIPEPAPLGLVPRMKRALAESLTTGATKEGLDALGEALFEDLSAEPSNELVAYRDGQRWIRAHRPFPLPPVEAGAEKLRDGGVYLITGGSGDLALVIAEELARRSRARVVLVGRTRLPERALEGEPLRHGGEDRVGRTIAAIRRIEALGGEALYLTADVSQLEQMREALAKARERFGAIHGVVHAAGTIKDELVQLKTPSDAEDVFAPKIHGTIVLSQLFAGEPLDFFVLFSSTSADVAPAGQVDYVAANAYLNAFAESDARGGKALAIHWGVWSEIGLAVRALRGDDADTSGERLRAPHQPLFDRWVEDGAGVRWLEAHLSTATHWLLDEHRTRQGDALVPGTGFFELIAEALEEHDRRGPFEVEDLLFLRPLHVPDGETRVIRVGLDRAEGGDLFVVKSAFAAGGEAAFQRHAQATVRVVPQALPVTMDLGPIDARCTLRREVAGEDALASAQEAHLRFGPRWRVLRSVAFGQDEALARLELAPEHRSDLESWLVHPALLDLATGFAMELIEGYDPAASLWAPLSYERVRVHRRLPAVIHSWVRRAGERGAEGGLAAFDVTITDEQGRTVLEVERFVVKRLGDEGFTWAEPAPHELELEGLARRSKGDELSPAAARLAAQVAEGIAPAEGAEAFVRSLGALGRPEIVVSSMDLEHLRRSAAAAPALAASSRFERPDLDTEYVAPRDDIEQALVGFWEELLGVEKIGVRDGFFDLGGHSLIAVRLFGMVRKTFAVDFPISVLFEAPTIERCAALIQKARAAKGDGGPVELAVHEASFEHLVAMHPGERRDKTPLFLCAGMFGNVLNLRHLAQLVGTDRPFYGLQARGLYGDRGPHESFEEMARDYITEIRAVQPHGPYLLGGFSGGGITAYEIAQQLRSQGEEIALLVFLDTPLPTQPELTIRDRLEIQWQRLSREGVGYVSAWARDRLDWELSRLRRRFGAREPLPAERFHDEAIEAAFRAALPRYAMKPYAGRVTLFRPRLEVAYRLSGDRWLSATRQFLYEDNGWTTLVRDLAVYEVPGDHDSMVLEPNVRVLAEKLRACIERAEGEAQTLRAAAE